MKKSKVIISFIVSIIILLSILQAVLSNMLSTSGILMSKIDKEIQTYRTENAVIKEKLFSQSSLTNIAVKAEALGFAENKSQFMLTASNAVLSTFLPLALKQ